MKLSALICSAALVALPVFAQGNPHATARTNRAGSNTITTSGGTRTMTNTEGNKTLTVSHAKGTKATHTIARTKRMTHARSGHAYAYGKTKVRKY